MGQSRARLSRLTLVTISLPDTVMGYHDNLAPPCSYRLPAFARNHASSERRTHVLVRQHGHAVRQFMGALRRNAEFRLLQVAANYREFEISLQLRSPVRMKEILLQMDGVSQVDPVRRLEQDSDGAWFKVQLARSQPPARRSHAWGSHDLMGL